MLQAARSLMFSSMTRMRQFSTSSSVMASYEVKTMWEFTKRVENTRRPTVLMITEDTDSICIINQIRMETAIAATEGTVDLVKVDILDIKDELGIKIISPFDPQDAPVVYTMKYGRTLDRRSEHLDEEIVASLLNQIKSKEKSNIRFNPVLPTPLIFSLKVCLK